MDGVDGDVDRPGEYVVYEPDPPLVVVSANPLFRLDDRRDRWDVCRDNPPPNPPPPPPRFSPPRMCEGSASPSSRASSSSCHSALPSLRTLILRCVPPPQPETLEANESRGGAA